jgi:F5/8 type C domain
VRARTAFVVAVLLAASLSWTPSAGAAPNRHWIGVRDVAGGQQLFDRRTGDAFVPRGASLLMKVRESNQVSSGLFRPSDWNPDKVIKELGRIARRGYNTVRVFIDLCKKDCISTPNGSIRAAYAENVAAFLDIATEFGLVVFLASNDVPDRGYSNRLPCCSPFGGYRNSLWLTDEGHDLLVEYWTEVVRAVKREGASMRNVIYEIQQEQFLLADVEPLSLGSGLVATADGESYDMGVPADKTAMVESNTLLGARRVRAAIRRLDPGALVTMGFFAQFDNRLVPSRAMLEDSTIDLVDLHLYPGVGQGLEEQVDAIGLTDAVEKPVVMGEFGAFRFASPNPRVASYQLAHWQADSCAFGFAGWLVWLWAPRDGEVYGAREGAGPIARILSPDERPNPCNAAGVPSNVAPLGTATASASLADQPPEAAIDDLAGTSWSAGADAPQSIEVDLGAEVSIDELYLFVSQFPAGATHHRLLLAGANHVFALAAEFQGSTADGDVLRFRPASPIVARYVRVETVSSPSWVSWREIQVFG